MNATDTDTEHQQKRPEISVIVPAYNEEDNVEQVHKRLSDTLSSYAKSHEIIFIDDGSQDRTYAALERIFSKDEAVKVIRFIRNFGQQMAVAAGLRAAQGNAVVLIDADMQTAPEEIPLLVDKLREGFDIVYGIRIKRKDPLWRRLGSWFVSHLLYRITNIDVRDSASGFIALDQNFVRHINRFNEKTKFFSGLFAWLSYGRSAAIPVSHYPRTAGRTKYNFWRCLSTAMNFICNFTTFPLRIIPITGALFVVSGVLGAAALAGWSTAHGQAPAGIWVLSAGLTIFSGIHLLAMGIIAEYLGRVFQEVKERPSFVILEELDHTNAANRALPKSK